MIVSRFRASARPDDEVVALLQSALQAAKNGSICAVLIVTLNPVNEVEHLVAGHLTDIRRTVLLGGLSRAANVLNKDS